jgi:hypothetical protein
VLEDLFYDFPALDEGKDAHLALASRAGKGVYLVYFLDKPRPVLAVPLGWFIGLQDGRDQSVLICFLPLTTTDVAVVAIVSNHLFSLVGNMGTHGGEPLQRIKGLVLKRNRQVDLIPMPETPVLRFAVLRPAATWVACYSLLATDCLN